MKKIMSMVLMLLLSLFFVTNVEAATCSVNEKATLKKYASNVSVTYETGQEEKSISGEENSTYMENYLYMKVLNLNSSIRVEVTNDNNDAKVDLTYRDMGPEGAITLKQKATDMLITYTFSIYGDISGNCYTEKLRTVKLTLPKYNNFSTLEMCEDIPDYYLCKEYVEYDINSSTAADLILAYKEELEKDDDSEITQDNTSLVSKTLSSITKYKYVIAGAIVVIGVVITIVIIRKRRNTI